MLPDGGWRVRIVILNYQPGCQEWVIQYVCTGRWGGEGRAVGTGMFSSFLLKHIIKQKAKFTVVLSNLLKSAYLGMTCSTRTPKKS